MSNQESCFFYIPFPDIETAKRVSKTLLKQRLIACSNILTEGLSVYRWEGEIHEDSECYAILKTSSDQAKKVREALEELHPYDTPCIAEFKAKQINQAYNEWIKKSVGSSADS